MLSAKTLVEVFNHHLDNTPNKVLYRFLENGEEESDSRTYVELYDNAKRIASHLLEHANPGDRVLLLYPSGLSFTDAFFGCLLAGVIAVPAFPPQGKRKLGRLEKIAEDCKATVILTTSEVYNKSYEWFDAKAFSKVAWVQTDIISDTVAQKFPVITPETIAFLQYTSGSTGNPKGVIVDHSNIIHNSQLVRKCLDNHKNSVGISWLPIYHDMGLIGNIIQSFYVGFELVIMPPVAFVKKPIRWLKAISHYKATTSGGPNFAFDFCCNRINDEDLVTLDLSSWHVAFNGAEPIRPEMVWPKQPW